MIGKNGQAQKKQYQLLQFVVTVLEGEYLKIQGGELTPA